MEEEFLEIVRSLKPSPKTFYMALDIFDQLWKDRQGQAKDQTKALKQQLALIDRKVNQFLDRIVEADNAILINTYEDKIRSLQEEKLIMDEKIKNCGRPIESFEDTFRTAITFLGNPLKLWESECIEQRRMLLQNGICGQDYLTIEITVLEPPLSRSHSHFWPIYGRGIMKWWRRLDLNQRSPKTPDLQSGAFDRSATPPHKTEIRIHSRLK